MDKLLLEWINEYKDKLLIRGIVTDEIFSTGEDVEEPCTRIDQSTDLCIGRICAWRNGTIDFEVLDIEKESGLMIAHYEEQKEIQCFVEPYIKIILKEGE